MGELDEIVDALLADERARQLGASGACLRRRRPAARPASVSWRALYEQAVERLGDRQDGRWFVEDASGGPGRRAGRAGAARAGEGFLFHAGAPGGGRARAVRPRPLGVPPARLDGGPARAHPPARDRGRSRGRAGRAGPARPAAGPGRRRPRHGLGRHRPVDRQRTARRRSVGHRCLADALAVASANLAGLGVPGRRACPAAPGELVAALPGG